MRVPLRPRWFGRGLWCSLFAVLGCGGATRSEQPHVVVSGGVRQEVSVAPLPLQVRAEAAVEPERCPWPGAEERCGFLQVVCGEEPEGGCDPSRWRLWAALRWRDAVDLDLYVRTPQGAWLGPVALWEPGGGRVLRSGQGGCDPEPSHARRSERVGWIAGRPGPRAGRYEVWVRFRGACGRGVGEVEAWVAVGSAAKGWGPWLVRLVPGERVRLATVRVPPMGSR